MEKDEMIKDCRLVIIGGSAGSLEVLLKILPRLNEATSFSIVIVLHRKSAEDTILEDLISVKASIPLREVEDKVKISPGFIYVAPSDYHLLFEKEEVLSLDTSEKINFSRPSIDVSFESAADVYGSSLVGILLSGANNDGTEGLIAIKEAGGITIVQDPATAEMPFMPQNAITQASPHHILDLKGLIAFIEGINA